MNKYRTLLLNIGLFGINTVATKLITFLLVPLYTYYLSTKEFGITDMSLTVISLVLPIASMSISDAVLRFVIDDSNDQKSVVSYGLIVIGLSCAIVALLLPVLKLSVFGGLGNYSGYFLLMYVSTALMTYAGNVARGLNQIKIIPICASISTLITGISAYLLIVRQGIGIQGYFISVSAGPLVGTAIYTIVGKHYKYYSLRSLSGNVPLIKNMLVYALPLVPNTLFWWLGTSINRFFITGMLGIGASGLYAAASKIPNLLNLAYSIFQQAWQLSTFQEYRKSDIGKFFSMILIPLQAVLTVGASFIMLISQLLASFMLQKSFYSAWTLIPVVLLGFYFSCMNTFYGTVYTTLMKTKYLMTTTIVGSLVCVIATAGLIPVLGLYGAGAASILCNAVIYVMRMINSRRLVSIDVNYCILVISIVLLGVQMMITAMAVPYYWVYGVLIFLVLTGMHGMRCVPLLRLVVSKRNR